MDDVGGALSNAALLSFARNLPGDSATACEIEPEAQWTLVPMLLARISDGLEHLIWLYTCAHSKGGRRPRPPEPIPRPGVRQRSRRVGRAPIPIGSFDDWYYGGDS